MPGFSMNHLKDKYIEVRTKAYESGELTPRQTSVFTPAMLAALRDMAEQNVYPDGRFGDTECGIWEMFRTVRLTK